MTPDQRCESTFRHHSGVILRCSLPRGHDWRVAHKNLSPKARARWQTSAEEPKETIMLDTDEAAAYEEWKAAKLSGYADLSVAAFNLESESKALAYEEGAKDQAAAGTKPITTNPYRARGMTGHNPRTAITEGEKE